jgi:hypothetical protein
MTQETLKLALEALEFFEDTAICQADIDVATEAITAIKEALAQPEQEPVAWQFMNGSDFRKRRPDDFADLDSDGLPYWKPLYTTPPQRTEQDPVAHWSDCAVHSEPAYPKGECDCGGIVAVADYTALSDKYVALSDKYVALKAQRTWQGLTDEEIAQGCKESWVAEQAWQSAVWWAEDKLKEKNGA